MRFFDFVPCSLPLKTLILLTFSCFLIRRRGSLHLIVEVPVTYLDKTTAVRVEIQIRSVAMDYWAELDSQMCYKKDAGQLEAVEKATKQYADVIAGVDKKMLELRKKIQKM